MNKLLLLLFSCILLSEHVNATNRLVGVDEKNFDATLSWASSGGKPVIVVEHPFGNGTYTYYFNNHDFCFYLHSSKKKNVAHGSIHVVSGTIEK